MSTRTWLDVDGNWNNTSNWSGGAVPASGDTVRILDGDKNITTNIDQSAVNITKLVVGPNFAGTIGSPSSPLKIGTNTLTSVNGRRCRHMSFQSSACTALEVNETHADPLSFYLSGGTVTTMTCHSGMGIRVGATATVTTLRMSSDGVASLVVSVDAGAAITTVYVDGGHLATYAGCTTMYALRGLVEYLAATDVTTLYMYDGSEFWFNGPGATITNLTMFGGVFDASKDCDAKSVGPTTLTLWSRAIFNVNNGAQTITVGTISLIGTPVIQTEPGRTLSLSAV